MSALRKPSLPEQDEHLAVTRRNINIHSYGVISTIMGNRIVDTLPLRLRCECAIPGCEEIIEVILAKRRELRRNYPRGFIVVISHGTSARSTKIYQAELYLVLEMAHFTETVTDL